MTDDCGAQNDYVMAPLIQSLEGIMCFDVKIKTSFRLNGFQFIYEDRSLHNYERKSWLFVG